MKKSKILMLLPAFLLVGCAKELSPEEAGKVIDQINAKRAEEPILEFKLTSSSNENGKVQTSVAEFSESKTYFHVQSSNFERWAYLKDSKYYVASKSSYEGTESKNYWEFAESAKADFDEMIQSTKEQISSQLNSFAIIDLKAMKDEFAEGVDADFKFSSKGDGSLIITLDYEGKVDGADATLSLKGVYEDYKPSEFTMNGQTKGEPSYSEGLSLKVEYSVNPSYPDLTSYTKLN